MKRAIVLSVIFIVMTITTGFSNGQSAVKETRNLSGFKRVSFGVSGELYINFGSEFKVVLEGEESLLEDITTEVSGGRLLIKKENWRLNMNERVIVYITMPTIEGLGVSGSGRAEIKDVVKADNLDLSVSGSGKLYTTDVTISTLDCSISGSGDIIIAGKGSAVRADISISGSGNYSGETLKIESAAITLSGSGNCTCNVAETLRASVSGSGNVAYQGNPKIDARVSGSGHVRPR
jgi:hypothetical protein